METLVVLERRGNSYSGWWYNTNGETLVAKDLPHGRVLLDKGADISIEDYGSKVYISNHKDAQPHVQSGVDTGRLTRIMYELEKVL